MSDSISQLCGGGGGGAGGDGDAIWFGRTSLYASSDVCSGGGGSLSNSNSSSLSGGGALIDKTLLLFILYLPLDWTYLFAVKDTLNLTFFAPFIPPY